MQGSPQLLTNLSDSWYSHSQTSISSRTFRYSGREKTIWGLSARLAMTRLPCSCFRGSCSSACQKTV